MRLRTRITLLVGSATGLASVAVAAGVLAINFNTGIQNIETRLEKAIDSVRSSADDPLSAALDLVDSQEITLAIQLGDGTQTVLQDAAGPIGAPMSVTKKMGIGDREKILFSVSAEPVFSSMRDSMSLTVLLVTLAIALAIVVAWLLLARDLVAIRGLIRNAEDIASGRESAIQPQTGSVELRELADSLQTMISRLQESKQQLQSFLSDASHELRTPLTVIRGYLELLGKTQDLNTDQAKKAVARSEVASARMQKLINDLLLLAELGEKPDIEYEPIQISKLIEDPIEDLRLSQPGRKVSVKLDHEVEILAAPDLVVQFVTNALANIRNHTAENDDVRVGVFGDKTGLNLVIEDSGPGIPELTSGDIKTSFIRFERSSPNRENSSGLGLSIMAKIMELHGGTMNLSKSELGGLKVSARFPLKAAAQAS